MRRKAQHITEVLTAEKDLVNCVAEKPGKRNLQSRGQGSDCHGPIEEGGCLLVLSQHTSI